MYSKSYIDRYCTSIYMDCFCCLLKYKSSLHFNHYENYIRKPLKCSLSLILFLIQVPGSITSFLVRPSTTIYGLIITWGPPSGSNYPTPVTYRLRYRERPSSGSPGSWSSTVQRTATQRQYTTPVLKPSTRYEVEVWAVSAIGNGQSILRTANTLQCM